MNRTTQFLTLALFLAITQTSCRWGNNEETVPPPSGGSSGGGNGNSGSGNQSGSGQQNGGTTQPSGPKDKYSGVYGFTPRVFKICANVAGATRCQDVSTQYIPDPLPKVLTDPVALLVQDPISGKSYLYNPSQGTQAIETKIDMETGRLGLQKILSKSTLFRDPTCQSEGYIRQAGEVSIATRRIGYTIHVGDEFAKQCEATMKAVGACYRDATTCGETTDAANLDTQKKVHQFFEPHVSLGIIAEAEIEQVTLLEYQVSYE